ncbi:MAG TPA: DUF4124 domain-containing protein [Steroidobacteraceae bacterium]
MRTVALGIALVCVAAIAAAAPTYRWIDADGLHYSDQPHPGAEIVTLGETQTYSATPAPAVAAPSERKPKGTRTNEFRYASCAIVQPAADQVLVNVEAVTVAVALQPAKRGSDKLVLSFDGQPIEPARPEQSEFQITPIERGTHFAVAIVRDNTGRDLCQSAPVSFHVRQPSVLAPGRKH